MEKGKIRTYKNVFKKAKIWGLPSDVFWIFLVVLVLSTFMCFVVPYVLAILLIIVVCGIYGGLWFLVEKYGVNFFDKLLSHYTESFTIVRKNRLVKNVLNKSRK